MPRVFNVVLAAFFCAFLVPLFAHLGDVSLSVKIVLLFIAVPLVIGALACVSSAVRPGSVGRFVRRSRPSR